MNRTKAHILLILMTFVGGAHFIIAKEVMPQYISPSGMILVRIMAGFVFFSCFLPFQHKLQWFDKQDYLRVVICAFLGVAINQLMFFKGLALTKPINASLIMLISPIEVFIISSIILKESFSWTKILGISLGLAGASLLLLYHHQTGTHGAYWGDWFILVNATAWSFYVVLVMPLMRKYNAYLVLASTFFIAIFIILPFGYDDLTNVVWQNLPSKVWWYIGFILVFATFYNFYVNTTVLRTLSPSQAGVYIYFQPIVASGLAIFLGKDDFYWEKIVFAFLIMLGVYLTNRRMKNG